MSKSFLIDNTVETFLFHIYEKDLSNTIEDSFAALNLDPEAQDVAKKYVVEEIKIEQLKKEADIEKCCRRFSGKNKNGQSSSTSVQSDGEIFFEPPAPSSLRKIVVVSTQRTGSNWVSSRLHTHPEICMLGENSGLIALEKRQDEVHFAEILEAYESGWMNAEDCVFAATPSNSHQQHISNKDPHRVRTVGMLIKYSHLHGHFDAWVEYLHHQNTKVIHLTRENLLRSRLSWLKVEAKIQQLPYRNVPVDVKELQSYMKEVEDQISAFRRSIKEILPVYEASYEELMPTGLKKTDASERLDLLEPAWSKLLCFLEVEIKPLGDLPLHGRDNEGRRPCQQEVTNWEEVANFLEGTRSLELCKAESQNVRISASAWDQFDKYLSIIEEPFCAAHRSNSTSEWQIFEQLYLSPLVNGRIFKVTSKIEDKEFIDFFEECLNWQCTIALLDEVEQGSLSLGISVLAELSAHLISRADYYDLVVVQGMAVNDAIGLFGTLNYSLTPIRALVFSDATVVTALSKLLSGIGFIRLVSASLEQRGYYAIYNTKYYEMVSSFNSEFIDEAPIMQELATTCGNDSF